MSSLAILCALFAAGFLGYSFVANVESGTYVATVVCAIASTFAVATSLLGLREPAASSRRPKFHDLASEVDSFAATALTELTDEYERHMVPNPVPLTIAFRRVEEAIVDSALNVYGRNVFPVIGDTQDMYKFWSRIPTRRLLILGPEGSGKTIAAISLARDILANRQPGSPVPALLSATTWRAQRGQDFRRWLTGQLSQNYPALQEQVAAGRTLAAELVDAQLILPVIDGFDELAPRLFSRMLAALNRASHTPLILTSRTQEYQVAVSASHVLALADGVHLEELSIDDVAQYLPRTTHRRHDGANIWHAAVHLIQSDPAASHVRAALKSPLVVFLARIRYAGGSPGYNPLELIDPRRFRTSKAISTFLVDAYIPGVYGETDSQWRSDDARAWLSRIARALNRRGERDFGWWDLRDSLSRIERMALFAVVGALVGTMSLWLFSPWFGLGVGAGLGLGVSINGAGPRPSLVMPRSIRLAPVALNLVAAIVGAEVIAAVASKTLPANGLVDRNAITLFVQNPLRAFLIGLGIGGALGVVDSVRKRREALGAQAINAGQSYLSQAAGTLVLTAVTTGIGAAAFGALHGFIFGAVAGAGAGIVGSVESSPDITSVPSTTSSLKADRANTLIKLVGFGALVGVLFGLLCAPQGWVVWLSLGVSAGVANGAGVALGMNAWGHWIVAVRFWLASTRRCPCDMAAFLADARDKGVLRQVGSVYQFRHEILQESLAR